MKCNKRNHNMLHFFQRVKYKSSFECFAKSSEIVFYMNVKLFLKLKTFFFRFWTHFFIFLADFLKQNVTLFWEWLYYNFSFVIKQSFWNSSSLLHSLVYCLWIHFLKHIFCLPKKPEWLFFSWLDCKSLFNKFSVLINYSVLDGLPIIFLHPAVSLISHGPGPGCRSRVWVQVLEVAI